MTPEISNEGSRGPQPWQFALGSVESRAAARMKLARWFDGRERLTLVLNIARPRKDNSRVIFGDWQERPDGSLYRLVHAPHVWLKPGEAIPACPDCGTLFRKTREYPGMIGYEATCVDSHDPDRMMQRGRMRL